MGPDNNPLIYSPFVEKFVLSEATPVPPGSVRITEDNIVRITEDGNRRVTE